MNMNQTTNPAFPSLRQGLDQARKRQVETIPGAEYLIAESGGFRATHSMAWRSPLIVMARAQ